MKTDCSKFQGIEAGVVIEDPTTVGYDLEIDPEAVEYIREQVNISNAENPTEYGIDLVHDLLDVRTEHSENMQLLRRNRRENGGGSVPLSLVHDIGSGVCKDFAATGCIVYDELGLDAQYVQGTFDENEGDDFYDRHAWIRVEYQLVDPIWKRSGPYDEMADQFGYTAGENPVRNA